MPLRSLYDTLSEDTVLTSCRLRIRPYTNSIAVTKKCLHNFNERDLQIMSKQLYSSVECHQRCDNHLPVQKPESWKPLVFMCLSAQIKQLLDHKYLYDNYHGPDVEMTQIYNNGSSCNHPKWWVCTDQHGMIFVSIMDKQMAFSWSAGFCKSLRLEEIETFGRDDQEQTVMYTN